MRSVSQIQGQEVDGSTRKLLCATPDCNDYAPHALPIVTKETSNGALALIAVHVPWSRLRCIICIGQTSHGAVT